MRCFLDIETEANEEALEFLPEPSAPGNYKDPDKIAAYVAEKRKDQVAKAALDADFGKVTAVAIRLGVDRKTRGWLLDERHDEKYLLGITWAFIAKACGNVVGYNIIGFDLPYLIRRSFALGVPIPYHPDMRRYQSFPVTDLMQILAHWDRDKVKSLKFIAKRYGIPNPLPDLDGSQYANMPPETRLAYVKNDVDMTVALYTRMFGFYPL